MMIFSTVMLFLVHMMCGPVATTDGSSGGAQPPPDPHKLPFQCESAPDQGPKKGKRKYTFQANAEVQEELPASKNLRDIHQRGDAWANAQAERTYGFEPSLGTAEQSARKEQLQELVQILLQLIELIDGPVPDVQMPSTPPNAPPSLATVALDDDDDNASNLGEKSPQKP